MYTEVSDMLLSGRSRLHKSELYDFCIHLLFISWYLYYCDYTTCTFYIKLCYVMQKKTKLVDQAFE